MEPYECPNQLSFDPYEQHYKPTSYNQIYADPEWEYFPEWDYRNMKRYGTLENSKLSNSFFKCEFPNKLHDRFHTSHPSEYQDYAVTKPNSIDRSRLRQPSGYANTEYLEVPYHNQRDCYTDYSPNVKYSPDYDSEWKYNPIPNIRSNYYPEPALSYDYDYDYKPEMYRRSPYQKKSVDFLGIDCEIPYNILKTKRNMFRTQRQNYEYPESFELLSVDIPFKETMPNHIPNFDSDYDCSRSESGYDYYSAANPRWRNPKNDAPSCLEELKRELLAELEREQRMNAQSPCQNPTPHVVVFPTPPANRVCPVCPPPTSRGCSYMKCWRPL
ncbi:hypothetical protein AWZ03_007514 [Drosophila navojoa]|uniref:Uncharacterized protein n=1 Tax=Drosophila navojoa TaxID=7232 RepID=A0A484BE50_DRONA|nr:hypothetical protein AWZ03_007514 [Drosophila navojoa]